MIDQELNKRMVSILKRWATGEIGKGQAERELKISGIKLPAPIENYAWMATCTPCAVCGSLTQDHIVKMSIEIEGGGPFVCYQCRHDGKGVI